MKIAYSTLLGEYVHAQSVDHADTAPFQICCPACRDPVFKVERNGGQSTFFSHHQKPKEMVADCELRVGSISETQRDSTNSASRGQSLRAFQRVLRDALSLEPGLYPKEADAIARLHAEQRSRSGVNALLRILGDFLESGSVAEEFDRFADHFMRVMSRSGLQIETAFSIGVQRRIALDLLKHLAAPSSRKSREFLLIHAYCLEAQNFLSMAKTVHASSPDHAPSVDFHVALRGMSGAEVEGCFTDPRRQKQMAHVLISFNVTMVGALLRLPYREMLSNHNAGLPLLEGIELRNDGLKMGVVADPEGQPVYYAASMN